MRRSKKKKAQRKVVEALKEELGTMLQWRAAGHLDRLTDDARRAFDLKFVEYRRLFPHPSALSAIDPEQVPLPTIRTLGAQLRAMADPQVKVMSAMDALISELRKAVDMFACSTSEPEGVSAAEWMQWRRLGAMIVDYYRMQGDVDDAQADEIHRLADKVRAICAQRGISFSDAALEQTGAALEGIRRRGDKEPRN